MATNDEALLTHLAVRAAMFQAWDAIEHAEISDGRWTFYLAYSYNGHGGIVIMKHESYVHKDISPSLFFDYLNRLGYAEHWDHATVKPALERLRAAAARINAERKS